MQQEMEKGNRLTELAWFRQRKLHQSNTKHVTENDKSSSVERFFNKQFKTTTFALKTRNDAL